MIRKLFFLILITSSLSLAADPQKLLDNLKEKYSAMKDFSADLKQDGQSSVLNGKLLYKKDNMFRVELKNMTIISDGEVIWNYNKKENKVIIGEVETGQSFPFSFEILLNDYPSKSNLSSTTDGLSDVLILTPKPGSDLNFKNVKLWVNESNLVERILIENQGQTMQFTITGYKINQNPADSKFKFDAPEGSKVIDLR